MSEVQQEEFLVTFSRVSDQVEMRKDYGERTVMTGSKEGHITIRAKAADEGVVVCKATPQNKTDANVSISEQHYFKVIGERLSLEVSPASGEVFEGNNVTLRCAASKGTHLSYAWWLNDTLLKESRSEVVIEKITLFDAGTYSCMANNSLNDTVTYTSNRVQKTIKVKEYVSKPKISFLVEKHGKKYLARISCESSRGTDPVNFTLYNQTGETIAKKMESALFTSFNIFITLGRNMGMVYCGAKNFDQEVFSNTLTLHVVPVGGTVTLEAEYELGHNFEVIGLTLRCDVEHGTFPSYHWLLNDSELHVESRGTFYKISEERYTLSLTTSNPESFGSYHCKATDIFDMNNSVSSKEFLVDKDVNYIPIEVVALVFGCFLFIVCLLAVCCIYGAIYREFAHLSPSSHLV
uniref:Si:dkey-93h22.7 n=1 Tax=Scleropages formosus TaxID=113540 RepID=A0A8C9SPS4_SCLFO